MCIRDSIWGFLAECNRRGWLYKGHDTMPWCPRCGTGLSQMEMNEGYQDREDPGLTVRFPLLDRPGEALLVWTTTPWTLTSNVAAAVGRDLRYVRVRQGDDVFWLGKGTLKPALQGPFTVEEEVDGQALVGWRYRGPYDELPAIASAFAEAGYEHRVVPWTVTTWVGSSAKASRSRRSSSGSFQSIHMPRRIDCSVWRAA